MIYLCTNQSELFSNKNYEIITPKQTLEFIKDWKVCQVDSETNGRDSHLCKFLSVQLGNDKADTRIVIDCSTVDIKLFKDFLENTFCIFQNGKFDLQFFFNHGIIIRKLYDTMIVEQLLHLGWPSGSISYSLKALCKRYLGIDIDKTVRGEIIWRGLDDKVIPYAASDVTNLEKIMYLQVAECKKKGCLVGAKLECDAVAPIAYMEWCGIHLDVDKWKAKMVKDKENLDKAKKTLDDFIIKLSKEGYKKPYKDSLGNIFYNIIEAKNFSKYVFIDRQGDLFLGYDLTPKVNINWSSSKQVVKIAKILGFDTTVIDKKTGEDKDSVLEKQLKGQKGICDEFLKLYFDYQGYKKVVTSFGQGHLNAINPTTHRIHTVFKQLGASSGRMSCGSQQPNTDLARVNKVSPKDCTFPNLQQLPADEETRAAFTAEKGNLMVDCDFSALESRLGADIYNESHMIDEFINGSGDIHSLMAKTFFEKEIGADTPTKEIKKKFPELRKKAKSPEFLIQFGGSAFGLARQLGCSEEEAQRYVDAYYGKFKGIKQFKDKGSTAVRNKGYVLINNITGDKMYWYDWENWKKEQNSYTQEFWDEYRMYHKGTGDSIAMNVKKHFQIASKWDRMALNAPTQGTGSNIIKAAAINLFKWIVQNNLFGKVKLCAMVHDELLVEFPEELKDTFPHILEEIMFNAAAKFCKKVPIPAEAEVSDHWIH